MFIAVIFTIAKLWKQPRCPTIDEWIKKVWCIYILEYYSPMKKNKIMVFAGKWTELENFTLSKASQTQKDKGHMLSLICGRWSQKINIYTNPDLIIYTYIQRTVL
jgi:hypothetical protein